MDWTCLKSSQFQQILSALPVYSVVVAGADRISDKSKHNMQKEIVQYTYVLCILYIYFDLPGEENPLFYSFKIFENVDPIEYILCDVLRLFPQHLNNFQEE